MDPSGKRVGHQPAARGIPAQADLRRSGKRRKPAKVEHAQQLPELAFRHRGFFEGCVEAPDEPGKPIRTCATATQQGERRLPANPGKRRFSGDPLEEV